jgi:hypothetical protein
VWLASVSAAAALLAQAMANTRLSYVAARNTDFVENERSSIGPGEGARQFQLGDLAMYVPQLVLKEFRMGTRPALPIHEALHGALLFADVSGFTQLTKKLQESELGAARGAEELNEILSQCAFCSQSLVFNAAAATLNSGTSPY